MIWTVVSGLIAGIVAKMITPQNESGGFISSAIIGILGAIVARLIGIAGIISGIIGTGMISSLISAIIGAVILLFVYHKFLADKLKLPI